MSGHRAEGTAPEAPQTSMQWLRRSFIAGFFVTVPLVISVAALAWIFQVVDGFTGPLYQRWLGREIPGLGIVTTAFGVLLVGVVATNVIGRRLVTRTEGYLMRVPIFRTIYAPVKQLLLAFSPDNAYGFKRVVLVEAPGIGFVMGFLTKEFTVDAAGVTEAMVAVYVPTNHLYLGDVLIVPRDRARFPDLSVEEGIRVFLTGGMSLREQIHARRQDL